MFHEAIKKIKVAHF